MIRVENLSKRYGELRAVDEISFEIQQGEIYGLLGPNGAGKTTTLSMLSGLLAPDEGRVLIGELDLAQNTKKVKSMMGVVPQEIALYDELTARENLNFWGGLCGLGKSALKSAVDDMLARVGLEARADSRVKTYSGGMKRRLNLALGLVHSPRVVLLDEPTVGIDPQARVKILDVVRELAAGGTTILYTTHYLEEAEKLCDRIGIMDHGKLLAEGSLDELKRMVGESEVVTVRGRFDADEGRRIVHDLEAVEIIQAEAGLLVLASTGGGNGAVAMLSTLLSGKLELDGVSIEPPSLNGLFLKLTGKELRD